MPNYPDPILDLIADLRIVQSEATEEVGKLRKMLNAQNESMLELQREIDRLVSENSLLRQEIEFKVKSNG